MLFLVEANEKYTGELAQFKKEVLLYDKNRKAQFAGCMGLRDCSTEKDWINLCNLRNGQKPVNRQEQPSLRRPILQFGKVTTGSWA